MDYCKLKRFEDFLTKILLPAWCEFQGKLENNSLALHDAFSMTTLVAHSLDHLGVCSKGVARVGKRPKQVLAFDQLFQVGGARIQNFKFRIIDGVNNSLKHVFLNNRKEYRPLKGEYGLNDFTVLVEREGKIFYQSASYSFDYARIVLRPIMRELGCLYVYDDCIYTDCERAFGLVKHVDEKISSDGKIGYMPVLDYAPYNEDDSIQLMIDFCNPICLDCGELEEDCECADFVYGLEAGEFDPDNDPLFDFDAVMSRISGAYKK